MSENPFLLSSQEAGNPALHGGFTWVTRHAPRVRLKSMDAPTSSGTLVSSRRLAARGRLLHELEHGGAAGEFLRLYFLLMSELGPADLSAVDHALDRHLSRVAPVHY